MKTVFLKKSGDKTRPFALVGKDGEVLKWVCSITRAQKVSRQMNVKLVDEIQESSRVHISVLAKQIRRDGESWADAMRRASKL